MNVCMFRIWRLFLPEFVKPQDNVLLTCQLKSNTQIYKNRFENSGRTRCILWSEMLKWLFECSGCNLVVVHSIKFSLAWCYYRHVWTLCDLSTHPLTHLFCWAVTFSPRMPRTHGKRCSLKATTKLNITINVGKTASKVHNMMSEKGCVLRLAF